MPLRDGDTLEICGEKQSWISSLRAAVLPALDKLCVAHPPSLPPSLLASDQSVSPAAAVNWQV